MLLCDWMMASAFSIGCLQCFRVSCFCNLSISSLSPDAVFEVIERFSALDEESIVVSKDLIVFDVFIEIFIVFLRSYFLTLEK